MPKRMTIFVNLLKQPVSPYLPMSMAKGLLPDTHPLSAASARSYALSSADVVVLMEHVLTGYLTMVKVSIGHQKRNLFS